MSVDRRPHPLYASIWGLLIALMIFADVIGLRGTWQGYFATAVGVLIVAFEAIAIVHRSKLRDSLSEITTWLNRHLSKPAPEWLQLNPLWGWNTLVTIQAVSLGRLAYVVGMFWGGPEVKLYILAVAIPLGVGQWLHWMVPGRTG